MEIRFNFDTDANGFRSSKILATEFLLSENKLRVTLGLGYEPTEAGKPFPLVSSKVFDLVLTTGDLLAILQGGSFVGLLQRAAEQGEVPATAVPLLVGV